MRSEYTSSEEALSCECEIYGKLSSQQGTGWLTTLNGGLTIKNINQHEMIAGDNNWNINIKRAPSFVHSAADLHKE